MKKLKFYWPAPGLTLDAIIYYGMAALLVGVLIFVGVGVLFCGHPLP